MHPVFFAMRNVYEETMNLACRKHMSGSRKAGFTLIELLVYIAIVGIIVIVAGQAFSNSTKMRVRTQSMLKASEVAENVATLLKEDIAQMGAKSAIDAAHSDAAGDAFVLMNNAYVNPTDPTVADRDSSSYVLTKSAFGVGFDKLKILRIRYGDAGEYLSTDSVVWYAKSNKKLYRSCTTLEGGAEDGDDCTEEGVEVEIAEGVESFMILEAKPRVLDDADVLFPHYADASEKSFRFIPYENTGEKFLLADTDPVQGGDEVSLMNMVTNFTSDGTVVANPVKHLFFLAESVAAEGDASQAWKDCKQFTFTKGSTYEISFEMPDMGEQLRMFRPGVDHFAVGIRDVSGVAPALIPDVPDFLIYPPAFDNGTGKRSVSFMTTGVEDGDGVKQNVTACVAFTASLFSPTVSMQPIKLKNVGVRLINDGDYTFDAAYTPNIADKKNVKAFRIDLKVTRNGEGTITKIVVPVPSNGV